MEAVHLHSISKLVMDLEYFMLSRSLYAKFLDQRPISSLQIYNRTNCSELAKFQDLLELLDTALLLVILLNSSLGDSAFWIVVDSTLSELASTKLLLHGRETQKMFLFPLLKGWKITQFWYLHMKDISIREFLMSVEVSYCWYYFLLFSLTDIQ